MNRNAVFDGGVVSLTVLLAYLHDAWRWVGGLDSLALFLSCALTVARIFDTAAGKALLQKCKRKLKRGGKK